MPEEVLSGGNVADVVVRVGDTVRKPATLATPVVEALLRHLDREGFSAAPKTLGIDDRGRHVLEYIPGEPADKTAPLDEDELHRLGALVRQLHEATSTFVPGPEARWSVVSPPDREDLVIHHDIAPWNLLRGGDRWVIIDWDGAGPGSRLWELAYTGQTFAGLWEGQDPTRCAPRLLALVDGYRLDLEQRGALPGVLSARTWSMYDLLRRGHASGQQPWARLYREGHWQSWFNAASFVDRHRQVWAAALDAP